MMAGSQKKNMFGGFSVAAQQRKEQQQQLEAAVMGQAASGVASGQARKRGTGATTITLAISGEDKARFKAWAATHGTTMSDVLHDWIVRNCMDGEV